MDHFTLSSAPVQTDPTAGLPWCVRPIARFLRKPSWTQEEARAVDVIGDWAWERLDFGCEDEETHPVALMILEAQQMIREFLAIRDRMANGYGSAPLLELRSVKVAAMAPVLIKPPVPKPQPTPVRVSRSAEGVIAEGIEAYRAECEAGAGPHRRWKGLEAPGAVFDATTTTERAAITRFLNAIGYPKDYANAKPRNRFTSFAADCLDGSPVSFPVKPEPVAEPTQEPLPTLPEPTPAETPIPPIVLPGEPSSPLPGVIEAPDATWMEDDYPAGLSGDDCEAWRANFEGAMIKAAGPHHPDYLTIIESTDRGKAGPFHRLHYHCPLDDYGKRRHEAGESVAEYAHRVIGASSLAPIGRFGKTVYYLANRPTEPEPTAPPVPQFSDTRAEMDAHEAQAIATLDAIDAESHEANVELARERLIWIIGDIRWGLTEAAWTSWNGWSDATRDDVVAYLDSIGVGPCPYRGMDAHGRYDHFILECLNGIPVVFPEPAPPDGGPEISPVPPYRVSRFPGGFQMIPIEPEGPNDADHPDIRGRAVDGPDDADTGRPLADGLPGGDHHEHRGDSRLASVLAGDQGQGSVAGLPDPGGALPEDARPIDLTTLVILFVSLGIPFDRIDTASLPTTADTPAPDFPQGRPPGPRPGVSPGLRVSLTLEIDGRPYGVQATPDGWDLAKPDGSSYRVSGEAAGWSCDCPTARFRGGVCKHQAALRAVGLIPATEPALV